MCVDLAVTWDIGDDQRNQNGIGKEHGDGKGLPGASDNFFDKRLMFACRLGSAGGQRTSSGGLTRHRSGDFGTG